MPASEKHRLAANSRTNAKKPCNSPRILSIKMSPNQAEGASQDGHRPKPSRPKRGFYPNRATCQYDVAVLLSTMCPRKAMVYIGLLAGILRPAAWGQNTSEPEVPSYSERPAFANIQMHIQPSGDVEFFPFLSGMPPELDFPQILRGTLGCDWQPNSRYPFIAVGACRHLLTRQGGTLFLNGLVTALHFYGATSVRLALFLPQRPRSFTIQTSANWTVSNHSGPQYEYDSQSIETTPVLVRVQPIPPPNLAGFAVPLLTMLLIPPCVALVLRRRNQTGSKAIVWLSWIQMSGALFWLVVWPPGRIVEFLARLHSLSVLAELLIGGLLYSGPPLVETAISALILRDLLVPESQSMGRFLRRYFLPHAGLTLIFTFSVIGLALDSQSVQVLVGGLALSLSSGIGLMWFSKSRHGGGSRALASGRLHDRVMQFGSSVGVRIKSVSILWGWSDGETNAVALRPSRRVFVTDSLLKVCTRREVDAVLAHEVGHLRQGPGAFPPILGWAFLAVYIPCRILIPGDAIWIESLLALLAFGLMLVGGRIIRRREFQADQWSAYCTQDPLAMISGLGRIAKLRGLPLEWSRLEGCILTHPSMRARAARLARNCNLPEGLAKAALEDPDSVSTVRGVPDERYSPVVESPPESIEFSGAKKTLHLVRTILAFPALILLLTFALAAVAGVMPENRGLLVFLLGLPLVVWLARKAIRRSDRRFFRQIAMAVSRRLPEEPGGEMVTLIPGPDLEPTDGFFAWDIGSLAVRGDRLVYLGERASFSLPRAAIVAVDAFHKRLRWRKIYGVRIRTQEGAFVFREALRTTSRRGAERIAEKWLAWVKQTATEPVADGGQSSEFPPAALPAIQARAVSQGRSLGRVLLFPILQYVIGKVLSSLLPENGWYQWVPVTAALLYCVMLVPGLLAMRSVAKVAPSQPAGPAPLQAPPPTPPPPMPLTANVPPSYHQQMPLAARMRAEEEMAVHASQLAQRADGRG